MATISTSGISPSQIIRSSHLLRIINALDGTTSDDIIISGSLNALHVTGSFKGDGSQLTGITGEWDGSLDGNATITGSLAVSSNVGIGKAIPTAKLDVSGSAIITGSLTAVASIDNEYTYCLDGSNYANSGSGINGYSNSGVGIRAQSNYGTGIEASSYSGVIARFSSNTGYEQAKLFANGNFLLNTLVSSGGKQVDTGYKLYVGGTTNIVGNTTITGSLINGSGSIASGTGSHAEGYYTTASGIYSHAEGDITIALGPHSHAEGYATTTTQAYSHAEGRYTTSSGLFSHAEGEFANSIGEYSHAEGASTIAQGDGSHAEGNGTIAGGNYSHAEGSNTRALGESSHAEGLSTVASGSYQHVQGAYNISSSAESAFIIGNGTSNANRSNLIFASGSEVQVTGSLMVSGGVVNIGTGTDYPYDYKLKVDSGTGTFGIVALGSGTSFTGLGIGNTTSGRAELYLDASTGDFGGGDYAWIAQNNDLSLELTTGPNSNGNIQLKPNDATALELFSNGSASFSGNVTINNVLTLTPRTTTPSSPSNGMIMVSGSGADQHLYCYLNSTWKQLD